MKVRTVIITFGSSIGLLTAIIERVSQKTDLCNKFEKSVLLENNDLRGV